MTRTSDLYGRPWSEREYIVVLHYYFQYRKEPRHVSASYIQNISRKLGRTPASIVMRMENFASIDPDVNITRKGLVHANAFCRKVFKDWFGDLDTLRSCAEVFIRDTEVTNVPTLFEPEHVRMPKAFGKYELFDQIGQGAFGLVYSCINTENENPYAIKFIRLDVAYDDEFLHRFVREIKALKAVDHPNIIKIHEDNLETEHNHPAFVMDLASSNLHDYLAAKAELHPGLRPILPLDERCHILRCILDAVETLHRSNPSLVHRDINPCNVLLMPQSNWVLADFSLAKFLPPAPISTAFTTKSQKGWGTPPYGAPEQYQDFRKADERADIHAVGRLMWDLFSELPAPPRPEKEFHGLPDELAPVYFKATAYDRETRYGSVKELRSDFEEAVAHLTDDNG